MTVSQTAPTGGCTCPRLKSLAILLLAVLTLVAPTSRADAQSGLRQAIATATSGDATLTAFYTSRDFAPLWVGNSKAEKRRVGDFLSALDQAGAHALPVDSYQASQLSAAMGAARTPADQARVEVAFSKAFLAYANDVQSGILTPSRVSNEIHRPAPRRDPVKNLIAFSKSSPSGFIAALPPQSREYTRLIAEKQMLEQALGRGGWGAKVHGSGVKPGQSGGSVTALSNRLAAMGYLRGGTSSYDNGVQQAVANFQRDHGLTPDGVAGKATLSEINKDPDARLKAVIVAMERERWSNLPQGRRHIQVIIPDFTARIIDNGRVTFETRAVVGKNQATHRTPEFSDVMEFMVVNPTWNVPHSITTREYLPMLQQNSNAVSHLQLIDTNGNAVSRGSVNFASYDASTFPYRLKEPPSQGNALGRVKFMFPNRYNIYLHDTPSRSLFARQSRAYSHGCVRLKDPFDFAYALLKPQTGNPQAFFQAKLDTGRETVVTLDQPLRVHLNYRTAFALDKDRMQYREDVYGRDASIFSALSREGVSLRAVGG